MPKREKVERIAPVVWATMDDGAQRYAIYEAVCDVADQVADIENQADSMMGDLTNGGMEKLAAGFLGMG